MAADGSGRVARCELVVGEEPWPYAERHKAEIAAHWQNSRSERPKLFDGVVYVLLRHAIDPQGLAGTLVRTDFKSFLYWRERGYADPATRDAFGSSLIRSAEGHVLLGLQTEGNLNAGFAYPPSGMIDAEDAGGGRVDIDASIARELKEETGLRPADLSRAPGYVLTVSGPLISVAIEWRSGMPAEALRWRILDHISRQSAPELADIVIVRSIAEIGAVPIPAYVKLLLRLVLPA